ncbi:MAG TPA: hypothetical protein VFD06_05900 [Candidatus Polarisedimenticolia bacterium]|nr:hypothetical protein [Candidatus Polarisedimenticolia bacterium]
MMRPTLSRVLLLAVAAVAVSAATAPAPPARRLALTFDDLPGADAKAPLAELRDQNRRILEALRDAGAPARRAGSAEVDARRLRAAEPAVSAPRPEAARR